MHKKVSYGGIASALCVLLLVLSVYLPSGKAAALFASSVVVYVLSVIADRKTALVSYVASALLGFIISGFATPIIMISFAVCFGNYPIFAMILEYKKPLFQIISKFILYSVYFICVFFLVNFWGTVTLPYNVLILYVIGLFAFAAYDYLLIKTGRYTLIRFFKSFL